MTLLELPHLDHFRRRSRICGWLVYHAGDADKIGERRVGVDEHVTLLTRDRRHVKKNRPPTKLAGWPRSWREEAATSEHGCQLIRVHVGHPCLPSSSTQPARRQPSARRAEKHWPR
eukprot:scaffold178950_cov33-Tisochrysis_lutea.AAC.1